MKKSFVILTFVLAVAAVSRNAASAAEGADWRFFHNSGDNSMLYYDIESVVSPAKNVADVWTKLEVRGKVFSLTLYEISCYDRRFRTLIKYGYDNVNNAVIELPNTDDMYPGRWTYVVPETFEAKLVKLVCPRLKEKEAGN